MMMRRAPLLLLAMLVTTSLSSAEQARVVTGAKLKLSDVLSLLPDSVADFEFGPSPPPGSSRLVTRREIANFASKSGVDVSDLKLPATIRVTSAAKRWSTSELLAASLPELTRSLPPGVSLKHAKTSARLVTSPEARVTEIRLPKFPRKEGAFLTTVMVELSNDGEVVARAPIALTLEISREAAVAAVSKGSRVQLVIESGPARIAATAIALSDGEVGETLQFRVAATQRILFGKLLSSSLARVVQ